MFIIICLPTFKIADSVSKICVNTVDVIVKIAIYYEISVTINITID